MNIKLLFIGIIFFTAPALLSAQDGRVIPPQEIPSQNLLKFNRFLMNPSFSRVGLRDSYVSIYTRNQWVEFDDAPTSYLLNYASRVNENIGVGLGLQQQNNGILNYFGANANYSYGIQLSEKSWLTAGANLSFFDSGIKSSAVTSSSDPLIANFQESTLLTFKPGLNLTVGRFDVGFYSENLLSYNVKTNAQADGSQVYSGHLMYTQPLAENNFLRILARGRKNETGNFVLSGSLLLDLPKLGWAQAGYDEFYGGAIGLGINLSEHISIGYVLEKGLSGTTNNLGVTHELTLAYRFNDVSSEVTLLDDKEESLDYFVENSTAKDLDEQEIERLKDEVAVNTILIEELQTRQDSIEKASQASVENQMKQMIAMGKMQQYMNRPTSNPTAPARIQEPKPADDVNKRAQTNAAANQPTTKAKINRVTNNNIAAGYYLVGNIFRNQGYAQRFYDKLKADGFQESAYLKNIQNNLSYVAMARYNTLAEAENAYLSRMDGRYTDPISILEVKGSSAVPTPTPTAIVNTKKPASESLQESETAFAKAEKPENTFATPTTSKVPTNDLAVSKGTAVAVSSPTTKARIHRVVDSRFPSGYYLVGNIFRNKNYAQRFYNKLKSEGFEESFYLKNVNNNLNYVGMARYNTLTEAENAYSSHMNGRYPDLISILEIKGKEKTSVADSKNTPKYEMGESVSYEDGYAAFAKAKKPEENVKLPQASNYGVAQMENGIFKIIYDWYPELALLRKDEKRLSDRGIDNIEIYLDSSVPVYYLLYNSYDTQKTAALDASKYRKPDRKPIEPGVLKVGKLTKIATTQPEEVQQHTSKTPTIATTPIKAKKRITTNTLKAEEIDGAEKGYYIIVNVYATSYYHKKFLAKLEQENLSPKTLINPRNNYKYVYLARLDTYEEAIENYNSQLDGTYGQKMWILKVE